MDFTRFIFIILLQIMGWVFAASAQNSVLNKHVLDELDYFEAFLEKFHSASSKANTLYVIRLSKQPISDWDQRSRYYFLVSTIYYPDMVESIDAKYFMEYNGNYFLIKYEHDLFEKSKKIKISDSELGKAKALEHLQINEDKKDDGPIFTPFPYCFYFKTINGKVVQGMSIGSCDPYIQSPSKEHFFY